MVTNIRNEVAGTKEVSGLEESSRKDAFRTERSPAEEERTRTVRNGLEFPTKKARLGR